MSSTRQSRQRRGLTLLSATLHSVAWWRLAAGELPGEVPAPRPPSGRALSSHSRCRDKRSDCSIFTGRGPLGDACRLHPAYMRRFCARACGFCGPDGLDDVVVTPMKLAGEDARMLWKSGARRWRFFELPVADWDGRFLGVLGADSPDGRSSADQCRAASMRTHVAMANYYDSVTHSLDSLIYRWDPDLATFVEHQAIPTVGAFDLVAFEAEGDHFLAIGALYDGVTRSLNSTVYRWDIDADVFVPLQVMPTTGVADVAFFSVSATSGKGPDASAVVLTDANEAAVPAASSAAASAAFLAFASGFGGRSPEGELRLFRLEGGLFRLFQVLPLLGGAHAAEAFAFGPGPGPGRVALVVAHDLRAEVFTASVEALVSGIPDFALAQSLEVPHGRAVQPFVVKSRQFVAISSHRSSSSYTADSRIFEVDEVSGFFTESQRIETDGGSGASFLEPLPEGPRLLLASQRGDVTRLYRWREGAGWVDPEELHTPGVYDVAWHRPREADVHYLGVARFFD